VGKESVRLAAAPSLESDSIPSITAAIPVGKVVKSTKVPSRDSASAPRPPYNALPNTSKSAPNILQPLVAGPSLPSNSRQHSINKGKSPILDKTNLSASDNGQPVRIDANQTEMSVNGAPVKGQGGGKGKGKVGGNKRGKRRR